MKLALVGALAVLTLGARPFHPSAGSGYRQASRARSAEAFTLQTGGITRTPVVDNATVEVSRFHVPPGTSELIQTETVPCLVIQVTPGDVEHTLGADQTNGPRPAGSVTFVPGGVFHKATNIGKAPFDLVAIRIKPTRPPAPAAPATAAPAGITRTTLIDNADVRVVRVKFAPSGREPLHTHPNDLLTVQISAGKIEILNGSDSTTGDRAPGFVQFLPRDVAHAYSSADRRTFELLSISLK